MARKSVAAPVEEPVVTVAEVEVEAAPVEVEPMGSTEAEPVLTVEEVVVTVPKPAIGAIGKMVEELLADASYNYLQILERVVAAFPTAKTTQRSIASVAADKGHGVLRSFHPVCRGGLTPRAPYTLRPAHKLLRSNPWIADHMSPVEAKYPFGFKGLLSAFSRPEAKPNSI